MNFFKTLFGFPIFFDAPDPDGSPDGSGDENENTEGLIAGKYKSNEEAKRGFGELQTKLSTTSEELAALKQENEQLKGGHQSNAELAEAESNLATAEKELADFKAEHREKRSSMDDDERDAYQRKLNKLADRIDQAKEKVGEVKNKGASEKHRESFFNEFYQTDAERVRKFEGMTDERFSEVQAYAKSHKCISYAEAHFRMQLEAEQSAHKKLKSDYEKNINAKPKPKEAETGGEVRRQVLSRREQEREMLKNPKVTNLLKGIRG